MAYKDIEKSRAYQKEWYNKNKSRRIKQIDICNRTRYKKYKQYFVDLLGGKCSVCGYNKCLAALEFHHEGNKEKCIAKSIHLGNKEKILKEVKKCILLCANCHRELHSK